MRFSLKAATFILGIAVAGIPVYATAITGEANIGGNVFVNSTAINFGGTFSVPTSVPPPVETGAFAGLSNVGGTAGTIGSLNNATTPVGTTLTPPYTDFMVFSGGLANPVMFDLTSLEAGFGTMAGCGSDAVGNVCTPAGSPFTLIQGPGSVTVELTLLGDAYTGTKATGFSPATLGAFTTQEVINGGTISGVLAAAAGSGINASYSAQFTANAPSTIPEPASMLLVGMGLLGAGLVARRKKVRS